MFNKMVGYFTDYMIVFSKDANQDPIEILPLDYHW